MQEGVAACLRTSEAGNLFCRSDSFDVQRLLIMKMFKLFSLSVVDSLRLAGMWDNNEDHRTINLQLVDFCESFEGCNGSGNLVVDFSINVEFF